MRSLSALFLLRKRLALNDVRRCEHTERRTTLVNLHRAVITEPPVRKSHETVPQVFINFKSPHW